MSKKNVIEIESAEPKRPDNSTKRKTSKRQLEACRANGAKSHGPKTDEGKAISRLNAVKHNLYSDLSTLKGEDQQLYEQYQLDHTARFDPRDTIERDLVAKMAHNSWRQNRACLIEAELFDIKMSDQAPTWDRLPGGVRETTSMALAYKEMVEEGRALESLHRHEASLVRQYNMYFKLYTEFRKRNDLPPLPTSNLNCGNEPNPESGHPEMDPDAAVLNGPEPVEAAAERPTYANCSPVVGSRREHFAPFTPATAAQPPLLAMAA